MKAWETVSVRTSIWKKTYRYLMKARDWRCAYISPFGRKRKNGRLLKTKVHAVCLFFRHLKIVNQIGQLAWFVFVLVIWSRPFGSWSVLAMPRNPMGFSSFATLPSFSSPSSIGVLAAFLTHFPSNSQEMSFSKNKELITRNSTFRMCLVAKKRNTQLCSP